MGNPIYVAVVFDKPHSPKGTQQKQRQNQNVRKLMPTPIADHSCLDTLKLILPILSGALSAILGFWFACRRDDRNIRQVAAGRIAVWQGRITDADKPDSLIAIHSQSVAELRDDMARSIFLLSERQRNNAQKAWDEYRTLKPETVEGGDSITKFCDETAENRQQTMLRLIRAVLSEMSS